MLEFIMFYCLGCDIRVIFVGRAAGDKLVFEVQRLDYQGAGTSDRRH